MSVHQGRDGVFNPTSPHSSSGLADSFRGTPDTRLTAFSPEENSIKSLRAPHSAGGGTRESEPVKFRFGTPQSLNLPIRDPRFSRENQVERDPFVSFGTQSIATNWKLSPTASSFDPSTTILTTRASEPEFPYSKVVTSEHASSAEQASANKNADVFVHKELSTDLGLSRCVKLMPGGDGPRIQLSDVEHYISILGNYGLHLKSTKQMHSTADKVYVRFPNIRDACLFYQNAQLGGREWTINYVHPREFSQTVKLTSGLITAHEGQLTLAVFAPPPLQGVDAASLANFMQEIFREQGDLFAFKVTSQGVEGSVMSAILEYCDNDVSLRATAELNGQVVKGFQICVALHRPDIPTMAPRPHDIVTPSRMTNTSLDHVLSNFQNFSITTRPSSSASTMATGFLNTPTRSPLATGYQVQPAFGMAPVVYHGMPLSPPYVLDSASPRVHTMLPASNYSWVGPLYPQQSAMMSPDVLVSRQFGSHRADTRRQNAVRVHRSPFQHHNITGQHNHVDVDRIREGIDVRTTIMLRNIPNKVDQAMLKNIVDESSWGKYDFMYLRIDFNNNCNVGYAFINFVDPLDIIDFVNKRGNQRWNCFKSDKVAEISYATIQGKDCLVQKFRNSSVMLEVPQYRPKLYYTINGPMPELSGQEEPFPEPDNQSKMKRSCENAEHVGLFTPNAGQHYRDEQRRRRSQFDRGTRLAAMEEYEYPALPSHSYSPQ
ncbi:hypothetical protein G7054_g14323 [Neopestalotiopsis clavispora]|nr:hypothetical protein G7054_g14323 [Neopestalotiopsis clavispora]